MTDTSDGWQHEPPEELLGTEIPDEGWSPLDRAIGIAMGLGSEGLEVEEE